MSRLSIGDLIRRLEDLPKKNQTVEFDFCGVAPTTIRSSRGYYGNPALGWAPTGYSGEHQAPTVSELIEVLKNALTHSHEGWKGGDYEYSMTSPLWVDNPGDWSSTYIVDLKTDGYAVVLKTECED